MNSVAVLARSRMGRVSFLGGAGLGRFTYEQSSTTSRTGCTGPWVVACQSGNRASSDDRTGTALIVVGGVDVDVLPRLQAFVSGRIGGSNGVEEAAVAVGVRTTLIPDPSRRGRTGKMAQSTPQIPGVRSGDQVWIEYENGTEERGNIRRHVGIRGDNPYLRDRSSRLRLRPFGPSPGPTRSSTAPS